MVQLVISLICCNFLTKQTSILNPFMKETRHTHFQHPRFVPFFGWEKNIKKTHLQVLQTWGVDPPFGGIITFNSIGIFWGGPQSIL